jgi:hypothetical protein
MGWYNTIPSKTTLESWIKHKFNVLFHGRHGVGKTSMVFEAFDGLGWHLGREYLYFSAATIDPWVDLIGVPARVVGPDGEEFLKLIRPESIYKNEVRAFFVDELNRSHKKVRNAMMELIQFKSINGMKFPNLEIVWAAVNPDDDDELKFDVEKLDPAQEDRFQIQVQIPYKPSESYFAEKFKDPEMAEAVCKWWDGLPDKVKLQVTPRRLEYAIDVYQKTGDLRYVIPTEANGAILKQAIQCGNPEKTLMQLISAGDDIETRKWLAIENNLNATQNMICTNKQVCAAVLHLLSEERLVSLATKHKTIIDQLKAEPKKYEQVIRNLADNSQQKMLKEICIKLRNNLDSLEKSLDKITVPTRSSNEIQISPRRKAQIFTNYTIHSDNSVLHIGNMPCDLRRQISTIAAETTFASNSMQRGEILQKLGEIVHPDMSKEESEACLKISEAIAGYMATENYIKKYIPVISTCLIAWARTHEVNTVEALFTSYPFLTMILTEIADYPLSYIESDTQMALFRNYKNEEFANLSDKIETSRRQNVEGLLI